MEDQGTSARTLPEDADEPALTDPDPPLAAGARVGAWVVDRVLGAGATGTVYEAAHAEQGERVAIKVLHRRCSLDRRALVRFEAEARAVEQVGHANIVGLRESGQTADGRWYHVMELIVGGTLERHLAERGALPPAEALPLLAGIAGALDAAHAKGIAHRDLKPDNVLLERSAHAPPRPRLVDFGLAKLVGTDGPRSSLTQTGAILGTPHYMAPEQSRGLAVDPRADVYSFGVVAYRALTGRLPFTGEDPLDVLLKHRRETAEAPSRVNPALPAPVDVPLLAMLAKAPDARPFPAGAAFAAGAVGVVTGSRRGRWLAVAGAALLAAMLALAVALGLGARAPGAVFHAAPARPSSGARPPARPSSSLPATAGRASSATPAHAAAPAAPHPAATAPPRPAHRSPTRPGLEDVERPFR